MKWCYLSWQMMNPNRIYGTKATKTSAQCTATSIFFIHTLSCHVELLDESMVFLLLLIFFRMFVVAIAIAIESNPFHHFEYSHQCWFLTEYLNKVLLLEIHTFLCDCSKNLKWIGIYLRVYVYGPNWNCNQNGQSHLANQLIKTKYWLVNETLEKIRGQNKGNQIDDLHRNQIEDNRLKYSASILWGHRTHSTE